MADIGYAVLILALIFAAYSAIASTISAHRGYHRLGTSARNGVIVVFVFLTLAVEIMIYALFTDDFRVALVASHSSKGLPLVYKLAAFYSDKAGSLMFWGWMVSLFTLILVIQKRKTYPKIMPHALSILAVILAFFLVLVTIVVNVFEKNPLLPADGHGLNPLLQNPAMLVHPPLLFLGFAGFAIVFAFAMGALISGKTGNGWISGIRRWALFSWCVLGLANLVGAWWAHDVGSWGGYWAWDPVENAGLMPWLLGTAFLHSIAIQRKRDYLKTWSMALIIFIFAFTLFSPFITHGGIESPLHGFIDSSVPPSILSFIVIVLIGSLGLVIVRRKYLRDEEKPTSLISREGAFILTNIILVVIVSLVFFGTIIPGVAEALGGREVAMDRSFFDRTCGPALLVLVFLMGICPLLGWRKSSLAAIQRNFRFPFAAALLAMAIILISGVGNWYAVATLICGFPLATIMQEWFRGTRARHRTKSENFLQAFLSLIGGNRPRYGGFTVHIGIILITIGVIGTSFYPVNSLINCMWVGGGIILAGAIIAFWPERQPQRRETELK